MKPTYPFLKPEIVFSTEWKKTTLWFLTWKRGKILVLCRMKEVKKNIDIYEKKLRELEVNLEDKKTEEEDKKKYEILYQKDKEMDEFLNSFDQVREKVLSYLYTGITITWQTLKEHQRYSLTNCQSPLNIKPTSYQGKCFSCQRRQKPKHRCSNQGRIRNQTQQFESFRKCRDSNCIRGVRLEKQHWKNERWDLQQVRESGAIQGPTDQKEDNSE